MARTQIFRWICLLLVGIQIQNAVGSLTEYRASGDQDILDYQWTEWSRWSACSRSCGGGASYQTRQCTIGRMCSGRNIRYKTCNTQECPTQELDFRSQQCAAYNDEKFENRTIEWEPVESLPADQQCSLVCRVRHHNFTKMLAPKVLDGTRCNKHSVDMCIAGKCEPVGCDYQFNSTAMFDRCGVCKGDNSTCRLVKGRKLLPAKQSGLQDILVIPAGSHTIKVSSKDTHSTLGIRERGETRGINQGQRQEEEGRYWLAGAVIQYRRFRSGREQILIDGSIKSDLVITVVLADDRGPREKVHYQYLAPLTHAWKTRGWGRCSVTCGGGQQESVLECTNLETGEAVTDGSCEGQKPEVHTRGCNNINCPARWEPEPWGICTVSCGTGTHIREVYCVQKLSSGINLRLHDDMCSGTKPPSVQSCNTDPCPYWKPEPWSQCSVSCGRGISTREIQCRNHRNAAAIGCDSDTMPSIRKICIPGVPCLKDPESRRVEDRRPHLMTTATPEERRGGEEQQQPSYHVGDWSPCSTSCGQGIRTRSVRCKLYLLGYDIPFDFSDIECQGLHRPEDVEDCMVSECPIPVQANSVNGPVLTVSHLLTTEEPTESSAGSEDSISFEPNMVDQNQNEPNTANQDTNDINQDQHQEDITEPNNINPQQDVTDPNSVGHQDHTEPNVVNPDPTLGIGPGPDLQAFIWRYGYTPCTASCIGGVQESIVRCVNAFTDEVVSDANCDYSQKLPSIQRPCNEHDCPPEWKVFLYDECSASCGPGLMHPADVLCIQMTARNSESPLRTLPEDECMGPKPDEPIPCDGDDCATFWVLGDWSECSAMCGEGSGNKTRSLACHQTTPSGDDVEVEFTRCPLPVPHTVEECDNAQCPPHWMATPSSECSKSCGRGVQTVRLSCHQITPFGTMMDLPNSFCPIPQPSTTQTCNEMDCHTEWTTKLLSQCSASCGVGVRLRSVLCSRLLGNGTRVVIDAHQCVPALRPTDHIVCDLPKCTEIKIMANYSIFHQRGLSNSKVRLVVGQDAYVFSTTTITVKCPVTNFKKNHVTWERGTTGINNPGSYSSDPRVKVVTGGILRIKHAERSDSGVYACVAGDQRETFTLHVQDPPEPPVQLNNPGVATSPPTSANTKWITSPWNECSVSCGGGTQTRDIYCERTDLMGRIKPRTTLICKKAGLEEPVTSRPCNLQQCSVHWAMGAWSVCNRDCVGVQESLQTRNVYCRSPTGEEIPAQMCAALTPPTSERICENVDCKPKWLSTKWSSCSSTCGMAVQKRKIRCVAAGTREQMDSAICAAVYGEPQIMRKCQVDPCPGEECSDEGTYCSLVHRLDMCTNLSYQRRCCKTCQFSNGG